MTPLQSLHLYIMDTGIFECENDPTLYLIKDTTIRLEIDYRTRIYMDLPQEVPCIICWDKDGCYSAIGTITNFEEVLTIVPEVVKLKLLFNLDLFLDLERGQYEKYYCRD